MFMRYMWIDKTQCGIKEKIDNFLCDRCGSEQKMDKMYECENCEYFFCDHCFDIENRVCYKYDCIKENRDKLRNEIRFLTDTVKKSNLDDLDSCSKCGSNGEGINESWRCENYYCDDCFDKESAICERCD
jgi:hypothetical protein